MIFDIGHGGGSFDYTVAEAAIQQGCPPDTISSDIHVFSGNTPGMPYLTWVMSKFMGLGFSLEQAVAMATIKPAAVINRTPKLGSLQVGAPGDVAIMELVEGPVSFVDTRNNKREGKVHLKPVQTVAAGVPFGRPRSPCGEGDLAAPQPRLRRHAGRRDKFRCPLPQREECHEEPRHSCAGLLRFSDRRHAPKLAATVAQRALPLEMGRR